MKGFVAGLSAGIIVSTVLLLGVSLLAPAPDRANRLVAANDPAAPASAPPIAGAGPAPVVGVADAGLDLPSPEAPVATTAPDVPPSVEASPQPDPTELGTVVAEWATEPSPSLEMSSEPPVTASTTAASSPEPLAPQGTEPMATAAASSAAQAPAPPEAPAPEVAEALPVSEPGMASDLALAEPTAPAAPEPATAAADLPATEVPAADLPAPDALAAASPDAAPEPVPEAPRLAAAPEPLAEPAGDAAAPALEVEMAAADPVAAPAPLGEVTAADPMPASDLVAAQPSVLTAEPDAQSTILELVEMEDPAAPIAADGSVALPQVVELDPLPGAEEPEIPLAQAEVAAAPEPAAPEPAAPAPASTVRILRLGGEPAAPEVAPAEEPVAEEPAAEPAPLPADAPAFLRNAAAFAPPGAEEARPLLSVILVDEGTEPAAPSALAALPVPVSVAIDPALPDAADRLAAYRAAGIEALIVASLPELAQPQDAEVFLGAAVQELPDTVALLDLGQGGLNALNANAQTGLSIARRSGLGVIMAPRGLGSGLTVARNQGIPAAQILRDLDAAGQDVPSILRGLDDAARVAGQGTAAVLLGRVRPDTLAALGQWSGDRRAQEVTLAPVSAVLAAQVAPVASPSEGEATDAGAGESDGQEAFVAAPSAGLTP